MELTNYWWLLIWIFVAGGVVAVVMPKQQEVVCGKTEYRWGWISTLIVTLPYVIWAAARPDFGDTAAYEVMYMRAPDALAQIPSYLIEHTKDKGFSVFMILFKSIFGDSTMIFFLTIAAFQMFCVIAVYRKYSSNLWISLFLFIVSTDYLSWVFNGIRQFIAVTLIFAGFSLLLKKKYVPLICLILIAATIHASALIMLPIVFIIQGKAFNKKTIIAILVIVIGILLIDKLTPFLNNALADTQYSDMMTNEIWMNDDGTNMLRVLVYSMPAILSLLGKKYIENADDPVINLCVNASILTAFVYLAAAYSSGIYIGRLPVFVSLYGYILIPWLIDNMFTELSARIVKFGMIGSYLVFFYYQMHNVWQLL